MRFLFAALLASQALTAQLVIPPGLSAYEGFATDGDVCTYRSFRATSRYPASWIGNPRVINQIAWRADATYAYDFDRLPGQATVRIGMWSGNRTNTWSTSLTTAFQRTLDQPRMVIQQPWTPQPFNFVVPLTTPVAIVQAGLEIDIAFTGPRDPIWGDRATYWVDAAMNPDSGQPSLTDMWLDPHYPYMGCAGWVSETRDRRCLYSGL